MLQTHGRIDEGIPQKFNSGSTEILKFKTFKSFKKRVAFKTSNN
jgi:hypothetical protein